MKTDKILNELEIKETCEPIPDEISGITANSRDVNAGYAFFAVKGMQEDGNMFIKDAQDKGASLIISSESLTEVKGYIKVPDVRNALAKTANIFFGKPSEKMKLIGITGTNGKTTVSYLLRSIYGNIVLIGTIAHIVGNDRYPAKNTTPSPIDINRLLKMGLNKGIKNAVIEVSSHSIAQKRIKYLNFDYLIYTNLSRDHLDYHLTLEDYRDTKASIFREMNEESVGIINANDASAGYFIKNANGKIITYGISTGNIQAKLLNVDITGMDLSIEGMGKSIRLHSNLLGRFNAFNILAAVSCAIIDGIDVDAIKKEIEDINYIPGRMERISCDTPFKIIVDYAHTPDGIKNALSSLRELTEGRIITVFGAGGDRDKGKRKTMGEAADMLSDYIIITSDNPRNEDPMEIIQDISSGIKNTLYETIQDRGKAIEKALNIGKDGDIIAILGKGHEKYQIIGKEKLPFNDKEFVKSVMEKNGFKCR